MPPKLQPPLNKDKSSLTTRKAPVTPPKGKGKKGDPKDKKKAASPEKVESPNLVQEKPLVPVYNYDPFFGEGKQMSDKEKQMFLCKDGVKIAGLTVEDLLVSVTE